MTARTHPDEPLVIGFGVLYDDEPDARHRPHPQVLGAISRGDDRRSKRSRVRGLVVGSL